MSLNQLILQHPDQTPFIWAHYIANTIKTNTINTTNLLVENFTFPQNLTVNNLTVLNNLVSSYINNTNDISTTRVNSDYVNSDFILAEEITSNTIECENGEIVNITSNTIINGISISSPIINSSNTITGNNINNISTDVKTILAETIETIDIQSTNGIYIGSIANTRFRLSTYYIYSHEQLTFMFLTNSKGLMSLERIGNTITYTLYPDNDKFDFINTSLPFISFTEMGPDIPVLITNSLGTLKVSGYISITDSTTNTIIIASCIINPVMQKINFYINNGGNPPFTTQMSFNSLCITFSYKLF